MPGPVSQANCRSRRARAVKTCSSECMFGEPGSSWNEGFAPSWPNSASKFGPPANSYSRVGVEARMKSRLSGSFCTSMPQILKPSMPWSLAML